MKSPMILPMNTGRAVAVSEEEAKLFIDSNSRWIAVQQRDPRADGQFWYSVATTGIYCYPSCGARTARRENIAFHPNRAHAERAGFRPCKRCRPELAPRQQRLAQAITAACRLLENSAEPLSPGTLAAAVGLSAQQLQRQFKTVTGLTLKQYATALRASRVRSRLGEGAPVTAAVYDAGYNSASRFYEQSAALLGMPPKTYARGGSGQAIRWDLAETWLGHVLVAATERGICAVLLGSNKRRLMAELAARFPRATLEQAERDSDFARWIEAVLTKIEQPAASADLPLDVAGTAFQQRVWRALRQIPPGETTTYQAIAKLIGKPKAARAVGTACGANPVAVLIPCHRVLTADGALGGYRWGTARKSALLEREAKS